VLGSALPRLARDDAREAETMSRDTTPSPDYSNMISPKLLELLLEGAEAVEGVPGLKVSPGLKERFAEIESAEAQAFICELYERVKGRLAQTLEQRVIDRAFIDEVTRSSTLNNQGRAYLDEAYQTVIGARDATGRLVVGPHPAPSERKAVSVPEWLRGDQVTLFGPPDTEKMSINAMNALHHRLPDEPAIVAELVESSGQVPRWGADSEDSKTPMMESLLKATENLRGCFDRSISFYDERKGRRYELKEQGLARPIKRVPGLALPDGHHLYRGQPLPLHLYDFAQHLFHNHAKPEALTFYIPKLENEEEAAYLHEMISTAEEMMKARSPSYELGSVRLFIVFENPRAIFRINEIADALHPYFVGGSLGWHDFLASTARLFKHDPNYQIPVKADPNIVINHIKESHLILRDALKPIGAISIGGMYGTLYEDGNPASFEVSMVGYIKDVVTQMKRGLDGFWVAHPNFVRLGLALVEAWRRQERDPADSSLRELICALVPEPLEQAPLLDFVYGADVDGLATDHYLYARGVLAADIETSDVIANSDDDEVRYNIFQALQYLTDWLCGNGCVALPAQLTNARGERVFVRVMDDLATTERSRWELWAEVAHGRVSVERFERLLAEEVDFLKRGEDQDTKRVQIRWEGEAARWYPIAVECLRELVLSPDPVEFVPELILPFTFEQVRSAADPWETYQQLCRVHEDTP